MARFINDPASTSFTELKRQLKEWTKNLPNYNSNRTFYEDEAGDIVLDLVAGFEAYITYNDLASTEENYLYYLKNRVAAIGITSSFSYNAFRGQNDILQLRIIPNKTTSLTKYEQCGFVNGVALSPIQDYVLIESQPVTIRLVVGDIEQENIIIENSRLNVFRFTNPKVSADIKLFLNSTELPISDNVFDMIRDYYYVQTNAFDSVDVQYLNETLLNPTNPYTTSDILTLHYIKLMNVIYNFPTDVILDDGIIDELHSDTGIYTVYKAPESIESIQINGPLYNETRKTIKARLDYPKTFKTLNSEFVDTNSRDVSLPVIYLGQKRNIPAFLDVTYIKKDRSLLTSIEKVALTEKLNSKGFRAHNIPETLIVDPKEINIRLNIELTKKANTDNSTYLIDIVKIFNTYYDDRGFALNRQQKLEFEFDLKQLEYDLERLTYVQIARASLYTKTWQTNTVYKRGDYILPTVSNGRMYEVISNTYQYNIGTNTNDNIGINSGLTEPVWSLTPNEFVYDDIPNWQPNTVYALNSLIKATTPNNVIFKNVIAGTSGPVEPIWGSIINELISDNTSTWQIVTPYEITSNLVFKTHLLTETVFKCDWNEYYMFNYGTGVVWN